MFPINPVWGPWPEQPDLLYIPLCFLLITVKFFFALNSYPLYIPLCFLLIHGSRQLLLYWEISLHSTMFPINPALPRKNFCEKWLYIPLCFLLIFYRARKYKLLRILYIPLCFLLIILKSGNTSAWRYALHSTMFPINPDCVCRNLLNVLLYIPLCFLLICSANPKLSPDNCLYIPLCFLLIDEYFGYFECPNCFTFHYVSY